MYQILLLHGSKSDPSLHSYRHFLSSKVMTENILNRNIRTCRWNHARSTKRRKNSTLLKLYPTICLAKINPIRSRKFSTTCRQITRHDGETWSCVSMKLLSPPPPFLHLQGDRIPLGGNYCETSLGYRISLDESHSLVLKLHNGFLTVNSRCTPSDGIKFVVQLETE